MSGGMRQPLGQQGKAVWQDVQDMPANCGLLASPRYSANVLPLGQ